MFNWFKKKIKCEHEYFYTGNYTYWHPYREENIPMTKIYCPKCDKHSEVNYETWVSIKRAQKIKKIYKELNK